MIFNSEYAGVVPSKDKKGITITNALQTILDKYRCKPNQICIDKGCEFYNRTMKSWLQDNNTEICSIHNERNLFLLKELPVYIDNVYIDKLHDIVDKYYNIYHRTIKMKHTDDTYVDFIVESNDKEHKFKVGDYERISTYENIFPRVTHQIDQSEFLVLKKLKILCHGNMY